MAASETVCQYPGCGKPLLVRSTCGKCGQPFCTEHDAVHWQQCAGPAGSDQQPEYDMRLVGGGRLVVFEFCISLLVVTFTQRSDVCLIRPGERVFLRSLPYTLITLCLGWWGLPWGPVRSIAALATNFSGGKDVTDAVLAASGRMRPPDSMKASEYMHRRSLVTPAVLVGGVAAAIIGGLALLGSWHASPSASPTRTPASAKPQPSSVVLLSDALAGPGPAGFDSAKDGDRERGYADGEFFIRGGAAGETLALPGTYSDAVLAVDARTLASDPTEFIQLGCRRGANEEGYRLAVRGVSGTFALYRRDGDVATLRFRSSASINHTGMNRLELSCTGPTIRGLSNGTLLDSLTDATYKSGALSLGVSSPIGEPSNTEVRFANLTVTGPARPSAGASARASVAAAASASAAATIPPSAKPSPQPTATPGPGAILFADNFKDAVAGKLPKTSNDARYSLGYVDGEYSISLLDPSSTVLPVARVPGVFNDASIAVTGRLLGGVDGRFVAVACRVQAGSNAGQYRLAVRTDQGAFTLYRIDGTNQVSLRSGQSPAIKHGNEPNRIELNCAGGTISADVNGTEVGSVQDTTYSSGGMWIGSASFRGVAVASEARFADLVVTKR